MFNRSTSSRPSPDGRHRGSEEVLVIPSQTGSETFHCDWAQQAASPQQLISIGSTIGRVLTFMLHHRCTERARGSV